MSLIYRGQTYTSSNDTVLTHSSTYLTYRGQSYQKSATVGTFSKRNLVYRGIPYFPSELSVNPHLTPILN